MIEPTLIPRRTFFGPPDHVGPTLSPDGAWLAWRAPDEGVMNVWVAPRDNPAAARALTRDRGRGVPWYLWTYTPGLIVFGQDHTGDENWHLLSAQLSSGQVRDLTPFDETSAQVWRVSRNRPGQIVVGLNRRSPEWHEPFALDLRTGALVCLLEHQRFAEVLVDDDYVVRYGVEAQADGGTLYLAPTREGWSAVESVPFEDSMTTQLVDWGTDSVEYWVDSRGRNTSALVKVDRVAGSSEVLYHDAKADVDDTMRHPRDHRIQAVSSVWDRRRWQVLDPSLTADLEVLAKVCPGEVAVVSRTDDDAFWVVVFVVDNGSSRYYLYDRRRKEAMFLFPSRQSLEGQPLVSMESVVVTARDGHELVCYLSRPLGAKGPVPLVLTPHGGPWWRDFWGYSGWHQWLANRGYAVLSVNFRSSTGFGKAFVRAGDQEWGGKILEDQLDAVAWAVGHGIADPSRLAVMGGSFGGYSTLAQLAFHPEVFACGVDLVGPSNLVTLLETMPPYWKPALEQMTRSIGDHRTEEGRALLNQHSPLTCAERIRVPLLIGQGANDPRVKRAESDQIVGALRSRAIPVTYVLYPDEGHNFARPENNLSFYALAEAFLGASLGGRVEPVGNDFEGSSLQVLEGGSGGT